MELAIGDHAFVAHLWQSTVAFASILNLCSGAECDIILFDKCIQFVMSISDACGLEMDYSLVNVVRAWSEGGH